MKNVILILAVLILAVSCTNDTKSVDNVKTESSFKGFGGGTFGGGGAGGSW